MTLFDFCRKKADKIQVYSDATLDENGEVLPFIDQAAFVTHYAHLIDRKIKIPYNERALEILGLWHEFVNSDKDSSIEGQASESNVVYQTYLFPEMFNVPFPTPEKSRFTFIDLFAGIGGFRLAMQSCGGECVFSSEWDQNARQTYFHNFGEVPFGDITKETVKKCIPDGFDVLCAGFPCQAFSIAGHQLGFEDTRGTLFFDVAEIIRRKRPKAVFLENVKNLCSHDNGKTFATIKKTLEDLGYRVFYKVMNSMEYANIPQNRERIFIVCFDPKQVSDIDKFDFPKQVNLTATIHDCIDYSIRDEKLFYGDNMGHIDEIRKGVVSKDTIYQWRRQYIRENKSQVCPTLTANMGTGGHNVPLILTDQGIRKLSPKECLNFQGYPAEYSFPDSIPNSAKYKQAGNSVVVPLITKVCQKIVSLI